MKIATEGVRGAHGRRIQDERPKIEDGEGTTHPASEENRRGGPPSLAARKLAGASENGPRGHGSAWGSHEKKEGAKGILTVVKTMVARR
jgi:hypothetical protein